MKEKNQHVLAEALSKLPTYKAPLNAWEEINQVLDGPMNTGLYEKLQALPQYTAPDQVWSRIQGQLRARPLPFYRRAWGIAAMLIVLISLAGIWRMLDNKEFKALPPMTEKKVTLPEMSDIQIADFENQLASQEAELAACLEEHRPDSLSPEIIENIELLEEMTQTRDSLSFFLIHGKGLPGTSPRLDRLDEKRGLLIKKLRAELCAKEEVD